MGNHTTTIDDKGKVVHRNDTIEINFSNVGKIAVREFPPPRHMEPRGLVVAMHGASDKVECVEEWDQTCNLLSEQGFLCLLPIWHSNRHTEPHLPANPGVTDSDLAQILEEITTSPLLAESYPSLQGQPIILLGKSWGAAKAATYAASHPEAVAKLVLVAPALPRRAIRDTAPLLSMPTCLLWARDDTVTWFRMSALFQATTPQPQSRP